MYCCYLVAAYAHNKPDSPLYLKVGISGNFKQRFGQLESCTPMIIECLDIASFFTKDRALDFELFFKKQFKTFKIKGEWFLYNKRIVRLFENQKIMHYSVSIDPELKSINSSDEPLYKLVKHSVELSYDTIGHLSDAISVLNKSDFYEVIDSKYERII